MQIHYISSPNDLYDSLPARFKGLDFISVDTEFTRRYTYYPIPSLIQIADGQAAYIIDLASIGDLGPLRGIMEDKNLLKVLHACHQDIEILRNLKIEPTHCFDTQVAMQFLNLGERSSFEFLVQSVLGINMDKSSQNSNWKRRPLTSRQIEYAANDVIILHKVFRKIMNMPPPHYEWSLQDTNELLIHPSSYAVNYPRMLLKIFYGAASRKNLTNGYFVVKYREARAIAENLAREHVIKSDKVRHMVTTSAYPPSIWQFIERQDEAEADDIVEACRQRSRVPDARQLQEIEMLKAKVVTVALRHQINPAIIATEKDITRFIQGVDPLPKLSCGWRFKLLHEEASAR